METAQLAQPVSVQRPVLSPSSPCQFSPFAVPPSLPSVALGIGSQELSAAGDPEDMYTLYALGSKCVQSHESHVLLESPVSARGDGERGIGRYGWALEILVEILQVFDRTSFGDGELQTRPRSSHTTLLEAIWLSIAMWESHLLKQHAIFRAGEYM